MRLSVVVRFLAVMLAAPLLALPVGRGEEPAAEPIVIIPEAAAAQVEPPLAAEPPRPEVEELRVSVNCSNDGCVVQNGLDVLVVGEPNASARKTRRAPPSR